MFDAFQLPFVQRGLVEILILSVPAGLLGTWIVLRGLSFFSHAVGTAAFPGLVLADGLGFAAPLGAFGAAVVFSAGSALLGRREDESNDSAVAIVLVGCLAAGTLLASDVFGSGANIETLLFGSLLLVDGGDIALAGIAAGLTLALSLLLGHRWLAAGFDPAGGHGGGAERTLNAALLGLIALTTTAALSVVGALLVTAVFVVPALTVRLFAERMLSWQLATIALVAVEGTLGLWLSVETDAPPGATIAVVAGGAFALAAVGRALAGSRRRRPALALAGLLALAIFGAGCGAGGSSGDRLPVVTTTTQIGDFVRAVGGDTVEVDQILQPNTDPHEYEPRPSDVTGAAGAKLVFASGDGLDDWIGEIVSDSGSDAEIVDLGAVVPQRLPGESSGAEASRYDPHWWHDPRNAEAAVPRSAPPRRRRPAARRALSATAAPTCQAAGARRRYRPLHGIGSARPPQAGHRPRCLRLFRPPLRDRRGRRRHPLADDAGAAFRQGPQRARQADRARARRRDLPRELAQRQGRGSDRRPDRRDRELQPLRRHARPGRLQRRHLPDDGGGERRRDGARLHRGEARMPAAALIEAEGLAAGYGGAPAIEGVEFTLGTGQTLALLGPNGGGKTTLLRALLGELRPLAGRLAVAARCGSVPQTERSRLDYPVSALDVATMGSLSRLPWWRRPGRREREAAATALDRVGLGALPSRPSAASPAASASAC